MRSFTTRAGPAPPSSAASQPESLCSLLLTGSGQEDELGHEKDVLPVEGPGAGRDQHCSSLQLPGSAGVPGRQASGRN